MFAIAPTDLKWYQFLNSLDEAPNEVNFWTPTPWNVRRMSEGDKLLFLLKAPHRKICGLGSFKYYENLSLNEAWTRFDIGNGVGSLDELRNHANNYVRKRTMMDLTNTDNDREIGCIILTDVKFFDQNDFISVEELNVSFPNQVVKLKYFDMDLPDILVPDKFNLLEELFNSETFIEGAKKHIIVNSYERNPLARKRCLEHYGYNCSVCGFNFGEMYGKVGEKFIHVHHLLALNQIGEEYIVDPMKDLRPVCPNCHAMLHKRNPTYTIEELKGVLRQ